MSKIYFQSIFHHAVTRNAFALGVMQVANFLVPLMVLPYLTRVLGIEAFGAVMFTLATIQIAYVITDYGFSLYATYEISKNRNDVIAVNKLIGAIYGAKLLLVIVAGAGVYFAGLLSDYNLHENIFVFAVVAVITQAMQPIWFFQGIERMKNITIYMVISKLVYLLLVIVWVKGVADTQYVILAWSIAQGAGALIAMYLIYREGYAVLTPTISMMKQVLHGASSFFVSRIAVAVYTSANTVVLGLVGGGVQVAFYGACDQLYKAGQNITNPINQALYPYMAQQKDWPLFFRIVCILIGVLGLSIFVVSFFIGDILGMIFGAEFVEAAPIMTVFLLMIVVNYIGTSFGYPAFGAVGNPKYANFTVVIGALFHFILLFSLYFVGKFDAFVIACATLLTETLVMSLRVSKILYICKRESLM